MQITIKVSRTVQITQYQPVSVEVTETHEIPNGEKLPKEDLQEKRKKIYAGVTKAVYDYISNEEKKYGAKK
jgi:hypothetical protein